MTMGLFTLQHKWVTYFHPDEITRNPIKPQVLITKLQVFNKEVEIGKEKEWKSSITKINS